MHAVTRPRALTVVIVLLAVGNIVGLNLAVTQPEALLEPYPRLAAVWPLYLACPIISLVALAALWQQRRWGLVLAIAMSVVVFSVELYACGLAPHVARVPVAVVLLVAAARRAQLR